MSFNKVDKALQSVGISMKTVDGQFRDFDEVIIELAKNWNNLDSVSQRYISTVFAGNRQQSRFLALVSNYDRLVEIMDAAENSQDSGTLQTLKTMDSISSKLEQLKTSFQEFYTSTGVQNLIKSILDLATNVVKRLNSVDKFFNKLPIIALAQIANIVRGVKTSVTLIASYISDSMEKVKQKIKGDIQELGDEARRQADNTANNITSKQQVKNARAGLGLTALGAVTQTVGLGLSNNKASGLTQMAGAGMSAVGAALITPGGPIIKTISAITALLPGLISGFNTFVETADEKLQKLNDTIEETQNKTLLSKDELNTLEDYKSKLEDAEKAQYDSAEAKQEYYDLMNEIADKYPELISQIDNEGNAIVKLNDRYDNLIKTKRMAYLSDSITENATAIGALYNSVYMGSNLVGAYATTDMTASEKERVYKLSQNILSNDFKTGQEVINSIKPIEGGSPGNKVEYDYFKNALVPYGIYDQNADELLSGIFDQILKGSDVSDISEYVNEEFGVENYLEDVNVGILNYLINILSNGSTYINDLITKESKLNIKDVLSSYSQSFDKNYSNLQLDFLTEEIYKEISSQITEDSTQEEITQIYTNAFNDILYGINEVEDYFVESIYDGMSEEKFNLIDELEKEAGKYSDVAYKEKLIEIVGEEDTDLISALMEHRTQLLDWTSEDFISAMSSMVDGTELDTMASGLSPESQQKLISLMKNSSEVIRGFYESIYGTVASIPDTELRGVAEQKINSADLTSITGIMNAIYELGDTAEYEPIRNELERLKDAIDINFVTEISSFIEEASTNLTSFSEALSKASKGLDLKEASDLAEKLSINLNDFDFKNGKYYLQENYYQALYDYYNKANSEIANELRNRIESDTELDSGEKSALIAQLDSFIEEYSNYALNSAYLTTKNFALFAKDGSLFKIQGSGKVFTSLAQAGRINDALSLLTDDAIATYGDLLIDTISNYSYDFVSSLTGALGSGEIVKITADSSQIQSLKNGSGFNIISETEDGAWIQVSNIVDAYAYIQEQLDSGEFSASKYNELRKSISSQSFSTPIYKAITTFDNLNRVTEEELINYANEFGISVDKLIEVSTQNDDGTYRVALSKIGETVASLKDGVVNFAYDANTFLENIDTYISGLSNLFSSALSGASFSEAYIISSKIGKNMSDMFTREGDKYYINSDSVGTLISYYNSAMQDALAQYGEDVMAPEIKKEIEDYSKSQASKALVDSGNYLGAIEALFYGDNNAIVNARQLYNNSDINGLRRMLSDFSEGENIINGLQNVVKDIYGSVIEAVSNGELIEADDSTRAIYNELASRGIVQKVGVDLYKASADAGIMILEALRDSTTLTEEQIASFINDNINSLSENSDINSLATELQESANKSIGVVRNSYLDAINSLFNSTSSRIASGISGSASMNDIGTLEKQFGIKLSYSKTSSGIKIKQQSLLQMYNTIKQIDFIASSLTLSNLVSSAMESNEELNDIWYVMSKISALEEEIDNPNVSDARKKELEAELDVAQGIYDTLKKSDNTFNFMNRNVSNGFDEPLSAWEGMGTAFNVLTGDDYAQGLVEWQDFSNMITMMGDEVLRSAGILNDDTSTAADLLISASSALANVDGKTVVDLTKLGTNFNVGAENMKEGLTKGIHTLAQNQIAILDAEIQMLETVVKTQEAFDTLKGDKTEISAEDFLPEMKRVKGEGLIPTSFKDGQQEVLDAISKWAGNVVLQCGLTIKEVGASPETLALLTEADRELLASIANALSDADWSGITGETAQHIQDTINSALSLAGYDYQIKIDLSKLNITYDTSNIDWNDENLKPLLGYKDEIEKYLKENKDKATITIDDMIKVVAGDDSSLAEQLTSQLTTTIVPSITSANEGMTELDASATQAEETEFDNFEKLDSYISNATNNMRLLVNYANQLKEKKPGKFVEVAYGVDNNNNNYTPSANTVTTQTEVPNLDEFLTSAKEISETLNSISETNVVEKLSEIVDKLDAMGKSLSGMPDKSTEIDNLRKSIQGLRSKTISLGATVTLVVKTVGNAILSGTTKYQIGINSGKPSGLRENYFGNNDKPAKAKGTLVGELGPELVVSNGRYYLVGQNGAEFVNLADDAIVFNHLQTKKLFSSGSAGRGKVVTNEKNAVSYATGNINGGPAKASASEALATLRQIRAQWEALLNASAQDLGRKAGSGGGGGGGGNTPTSITHDLERWYNLLRQIEKLEQKITYQQTKRANLQNGYDYVNSLELELSYLKKQQKAYEDLARLQKDYYDRRRQDLLSTDYSLIFTYDEDGLMQYVDGMNRGLDILAKLNETDANGAPINNAKDSTAQLNYLKSIGFDIAHLSTNSDGSTAEDDDQRMQNFWDNIDGWMDELDGLYDEYNEHLTNVEENTAKQNEILQEYIDNQLSIEGKLLTAIEDRQQAIIDKLQDQKDALEEASQNYIEGLNEALKKEKNLYNRNENEAETARLQRQLAILQRSGASASEINALKDQIDNRLKDDYFDKMQEQIDAVQEASDKQLEKLQAQIDLMTETLEYQKENGLLWQEVYQMLNNWTPERILQFIEEYTKSYKENSALQNQESSKETLKELQIWDAKKNRDNDWEQYYNNLDAKYNDVKEANKEKAYAAYSAGYSTGGKAQAEANANAVFEEALKNSQNPAPAPSVPDSGSSGGSAEVPTEEETTRKAKFKNKNYKVYSYDDKDTYTKGPIVYANGKDDVEFTMYDESEGRILISGVDGRGNKIEKRWVPKKYFQYKKGGLVDFTGPAWVDGTKSRPEAFLSAEDTSLLKDKIFSNSDYSLKSIIESIKDFAKSLFNDGSSSSGYNITIEKAEVNIQPGVISNDYDARRAGELALEEMVKIARKSGNRTISRR